MGRLFLVELDIVPGQGTEHYRCRKCFFEDLTADTLYIALKNKCVHEEFLSDRKYAMITLITRARRGKLGENQKPAHFFSEVVNVAIGKPVVQDYLGKPGIMADVYCNNCNMHLGWKIIQSFRPEYDILEGVYALDRTKLRHWVDATCQLPYLLRLESIFELMVCQ